MWVHLRTCVHLRRMWADCIRFLPYNFKKLYGATCRNARATLNTTKSRMVTNLKLRPPSHYASLVRHAKSWPTPTYGCVRYLESYRILAILGTHDRGLGVMPSAFADLRCCIHACTAKLLLHGLSNIAVRSTRSGQSCSLGLPRHHACGHSGQLCY